MHKRVFRIGWDRLKSFVDYDVEVEFTEESVVNLVVGEQRDIFENFFMNTLIFKPNILIYECDYALSMIKKLLKRHLDEIIGIHGNRLLASKFCELELYSCNSDGHRLPLPDEEPRCLYTGMRIMSEAKKNESGEK